MSSASTSSIPSKSTRTALRKGDRALRAYRGTESGTNNSWDLAEQYLPLVKSIVSRMRIYFPSHVDIEDIYGVAVSGLLSAVQKFNPAKGKAFGSYATLRIRGALIDEMRRLDWMPRSTRAMAKKLRIVLENLEQKHSRPPTEEEIRLQMGLSAKDYAQLLAKVRPITFISLDKTLSVGNSDIPAIHESIDDVTQVNAREQCETRDMVKIIKERIKDLPEIPRKILLMYYYEGMRLAEIAAVFGLTESRICQIHSQAILSLRATISRLNNP